MIPCDAHRHGLLQLGREGARGILVERAEKELASVGGLETKGLALLASGPGHGAYSSRVGIHVQYRDRDWGSPHLAILATQQEAMEPTRSVLFAGSLEGRLGLTTGRLLSGYGPNRHCGTQDERYGDDSLPDPHANPAVFC